ncbi:FAD-binding oxidoreductase [Noviherbaspirillum saxi]|uniref:FAD-binding oxidoreductase n=1 Tax=Noviherbaspirillum saxi TaxID=2320863 RepID=A0A3A3FIM7_9BURK|nr:FAD-binding oxidoreductase [Noviherbaspirillum saxi]RJF95343.1 FAD-binding oxidoreductase [Noviherbaspirillum saxi]
MDDRNPLSRRKFLALSLAGAGLLSVGMPIPVSAADLLVPNVTGLYIVKVARIISPVSTAEISELVSTWPGRIAVGGGRYSMGGQIAIRDGLHLDMRSMSRVVWFRPEARAVRVQAGMRWRDLQEIIDSHNLAVKTMQSYSNFTVGGSVSVNAHGRYVGNGPICYSVRSLQIVLADGSIIEANRDQNSEIFSAAFGGYGGVGVITEVELELVENLRMERGVEIIPLDQYPDFFKKKIEQDSATILHNADLMPPLFDVPVSVTWRATSKPLTEFNRLIPRGLSYGTEQSMIWALTELPGGAKLQRDIIRPLLLDKPVVKWRNHEASLDVAELEPRTRAVSTYVLQEYFIPIRNFVPFARGMASILRKHDVEALNISIRHSPADKVSILPWAKEEVFSFVLYYKQRTHRRAQEDVGRWTRALIDLALANSGRYYLPYQPHATVKQFNEAYPEAGQFRKIKKSVDAQNKFTNELWNKYLWQT